MEDIQQGSRYALIVKISLPEVAKSLPPNLIHYFI